MTVPSEEVTEGQVPLAYMALNILQTHPQIKLEFQIENRTETYSICSAESGKTRSDDRQQSCTKIVSLPQPDPRHLHETQDPLRLM